MKVVIIMVITRQSLDATCIIDGYHLVERSRGKFFTSVERKVVNLVLNKLVQRYLHLSNWWKKKIKNYL